MFAYRHGFHAGNHGDVLKHTVLIALARHLQAKPKGLRFIDTHAGAGGYRLPAQGPQGRPPEWQAGIGRLWAPAVAAQAPALVADWLAQVRGFNGPGALQRYPGSPRLLRALLRPQDELRLFELHPTEHTALAEAFGGDATVKLVRGDGFGGLMSLLPPPSRRALVVIDPAYEHKADYAEVLRAVRAALQRFAEGVVMVWQPLVNLREAAQLPQRLKAAAQAAPKGWLQAQLVVGRHDARGFGLRGSAVFVFNPPHTLQQGLAQALPWLAEQLGQVAEAGWGLEGELR